MDEAIEFILIIIRVPANRHGIRIMHRIVTHHHILHFFGLTRTERTKLHPSWWRYDNEEPPQIIPALEQVQDDLINTVYQNSKLPTL